MMEALEAIPTADLLAEIERRRTADLELWLPALQVMDKHSHLFTNYYGYSTPFDEDDQRLIEVLQQMFDAMLAEREKRND